VRNNRYRLKPDEILALQRSRANNIRNVLVIGDLHEPFCLDEYLDWCKLQYETYFCNKVVFIGDIIDNHYSSYHETSADGLGGLAELELSIERIARWYKAFPTATVIIGNHDRMIMRKSQTSAIPSKWIKSYTEVLEVPNWDFVERFEQDDVQYIHGEGGTARTKCRADMMNTVQGHLHTQCYTEHYVGQNYRIYGTQTGCGINHESYAMAYAKYGKKPAIGCAVILNNGTLPINLLMPL
jgi:metallophosphoesterase superfamily enzyme